MKNIYSTFLIIFFFTNLFSQQSSTGVPDTVKNVAKNGSTGAYSISSNGYLNHNGTSFGNAPITANCIVNCVSDYLYFHTFNFNIPANAIITGVEVTRTRGGCNSGSWAIDTLHLAYNNSIISSPKRDSTTNITTGTLGNTNDLWGSLLTPSIVNNNSFGIFLNTTGNGICTYGQFDLRLTIYYCTQNSNAQNVPDSVMNIAKNNSTGAYTIQLNGHLNHDGTQFTNAPVTVNCTMNCKSDYLYLYDFGFNIPANATITGVEALHKSGGCNTGSYVIDTIHLVNNGNIISLPKRDSATNNTVNYLGSPNDIWGTNLTPSIINNNHFGVFINTTGFGVCTYAQWDFRLTIYYCTPSSEVNDVIIENDFQIYPNPTNNYITIKITHNLFGSYKIYDLTGKIIYNGVINNNETNIDLSNLLKGIYFVSVNNTVKKVIVE